LKHMRVNDVIKCLILFDFAVLTASGLVAPIFAIFVASSIVGGSVAVAGFASSLQLVSFSIARLSSAYYVDTKLSEKQRVALLALGTHLISASYFLYVAARLPWHVYLLQALNGVGVALRYSPFMSLFTRYIDRGQESSEWGVAAVATSMGQALAAAMGGMLAERYGFSAVFMAVGALVLMSSFIPIAVCREVRRARCVGPSEPTCSHAPSSPSTIEA
jgi:MFS family permease